MLLLFRLVNLVKCSAISEVIRLCFGPPSEDWIIDRHQFQLRQLFEQFRRNKFRFSRPVEMLRGQGLAFFRIKILEIGFGRFACAFRIDIGIDDCHRWLA